MSGMQPRRLIAGLPWVREYDGFTRDGTSKYVHVVHIGGERWYVEIGAGGVYARFGSWAFSCGVEWADG